MPLTLHYHPLSSCCHKVLIALDVLGIEADLRLLNLGDADERAAYLALWPTGKMPLLVEQRHHAAPGRTLIPHDADAALQVRLWDRLFDLCVMTPMQACTADLLRPEGQRDAHGAAQARAQLLQAYAWTDRHLQERGPQGWVASPAFSLADCAAAPALFYAASYVPLLPSQHPHLTAYFERLMVHAAVARTLEQARPWFKFYPGRAGLSARYFDPAHDA